jgi:hypothetical protein
MSIKHRVHLFVVTLLVAVFLLGPVSTPQHIGDCPTDNGGLCTG